MFTVIVELTLAALRTMMHNLLWQERNEKITKDENAITMWDKHATLLSADNDSLFFLFFFIYICIYIFTQTTGGNNVASWSQCNIPKHQRGFDHEELYSHWTAKWDRNIWIHKQCLGKYYTNSCMRTCWFFYKQYIWTQL